MTDLQTIQNFVRICHAFNAGDAGTRGNVCAIIIPTLRRYRCEMVSALAFARQSAIKRSYADILAQNRSIRHAIVAAERRLGWSQTRCHAAGYDVDGEFDEYGAFEEPKATNGSQLPTGPANF
ncbi:hypothetical protein [Pseudomonas sp. NPDC089569]|uniref:hypothetical protein n=1 Tax=Pseudomonas sp. NPDC089569 TaxID=3390722 RepID=UPI003D010EE9